MVSPCSSLPFPSLSPTSGRHSPRSRPRTAQPTCVPFPVSTTSDTSAHSRRPPDSTSPRRPNTAPSRSTASPHAWISRTESLSRAPDRVSPSPPRLTPERFASPSRTALAAELSSFRMRPLPPSPTSATFAKSCHAAHDDAISPLDRDHTSRPRPRDNREHSRNSSLSSSDDLLPGNALRAGSAIADYNYFNLDYSFLEEEPPSTRVSQASRQGRFSTSASSAEDSADEEAFGSRRTSRQVFPQSPRRSDPVKRTALPFPSRPSNNRRISVESTASRKSSVYSVRSLREDRPRLPTGLTASLTAGNRLSLASFVSSELSPGEQPQRNSSLSFPGRPTGYFDFAERRKRLATFLDETAEAMEGGKSLTMVLPEGSNRPLSQYVEPLSPTEQPPNFPADYDARIQAADRRETMYFTPRIEEPVSSPTEASTEEVRARPDEIAVTGLGFDRTENDAALPHGVDASPNTLRGPSPLASPKSPHPIDNEVPKEEEEEAVVATRRIQAAQEEKLAEKRRRTIKELIETEMAYAVDMMVVRDIYLARAKGAHMTQIADYVMSTGLGLGAYEDARPLSPASPTSSTFAKASTIASKVPRRSLSSSVGSATIAQPNLMPGQPLMSTKDVHVIFANLEEIASLAETFAGMLDDAAGEGGPGPHGDRIGETFLEMLPRIQRVYSNYCVRHHRAIVRLQELEPTLRTYLSECKTLSHGRTNAWDLASLLIKPVQRCLKYPLLLDQILTATPEDHPDRTALQRANTDILVVADAINESKKRSETVARIVSKEKNGQRRESTKSISSMGTTMTKKLLRTSQKAKGMFGMNEAGGDEIFETLVALVESTRSGVVRFSNEMRDWTRTTKGALEAQVTMVEGWIDLYAPLGGEKPIGGGPHHRLCVFLDEVLIPVIEGPWRELDHEVRRSLIVKTEHLLSLFDNPRQVISKRNDKLLDHHRYVAKKLPSDRKGSEDFVILTSQLLEELPRFLGSVSRYFNIIVAHFAGTQAAYHEALQHRWSEFSQQWLSRSPGGSVCDSVDSIHASAHQPVAQIMDSLAAGLGIAVTPAASARKVGSRFSRSASASTTGTFKTIPSPLDSEPRSVASQSYFSDVPTDYASDQATNRGSFVTSHRSSATSMSSLPSNNDPATPPPSMPGPTESEGSNTCKRPSSVTSEPLGGYDHQSMVLRYDAPLPSIPAPTEGSGPFLRRPSVDINPPTRNGRPAVGRSAETRCSDYSLSVYASSIDGIEQDEFLERDGPLYVAEAISPSQSSAYRAGYPILSFATGERIEIELEEADRAEGGSGWLLGRKIGGNGRLGWVRTEDFAMVEDGDEGRA